MTLLYVDECGEEGFNETSSNWLILSGVIQPSIIVRDRMIAQYDSFKSEHFEASWNFHFHKRKHDERLGFIRQFQSCGLRAVAVGIYKPHIQKQENFRQKYYLYFYALRFLLEKATNWCATNNAQPLGVLLSGRRGLEPNNLTRYLERVSMSSTNTQDRMAWTHIDTNDITVKQNKDYRGLQIADCVASSIGKALEYSKFGTLEPRYLQELYPLFNAGPSSYNSAIRLWPSMPTLLYNEGWRDIIEYDPKAKVRVAPLGSGFLPPSGR